jgi:ribosomal silencing factor RsfS
MLLAQAIVEHGLIDTVVQAVRNAIEQVSYYVGTGNTKWVIIGLAVIMTIIFFKPKR